MPGGELARIGQFTLGACLFWFSGHGWAVAGGLNVSPMRVLLSPARPIEAILVRNDDSQAAVVQSQLFRWSQEAGRDLYTSTREVLASPPIFTLHAGKSQIVRVGLRRPFPQEGEISYRLYLQELPSPLRVNENGLRVVLRIGLPVFISADPRAAPSLQWQIARKTPGMLEVGLKNAGNAHLQITSLMLSMPSGEPVAVAKNVLNYLLPGQTRSWLIQNTAFPPGTPLRLAAQTNVGEVHAELALAEP